MNLITKQNVNKHKVLTLGLSGELIQFDSGYEAIGEHICQSDFWHGCRAVASAS